MSPDELRQAISILWPGHGGQTRAAEAFSIDGRRIRGYLAGKPAVPAWLADEISELLRQFPDGIGNVDPRKTVALLQSHLERKGLSTGEASASILAVALANARAKLGADMVAGLLESDEQ